MTLDNNNHQTNQRKTRDIEEEARRLMQAPLSVPFTLDAAIESELQRRERRIQLLKKGLSDDNDFNELIRKLDREEVTPTSHEAVVELDQYIRGLCADRIERDLPPSPWRDYALTALRMPGPPSEQAMRRNGRLHRDYVISLAVLWAEYAGLKPTRNQAQRYKDGAAHSACSLVADELHKRGTPCSEDAVEKIWRKYASCFRLVQRSEK